jgi:hypothetical protein
MATTPKCKTTTGSPFDQMFQTAAEQVRTAWGNNENRVGETFYRALLAEAIYDLIMRQGALMSDETRGRILADGWAFITEHVEQKFS